MSAIYSLAKFFQHPAVKYAAIYFLVVVIVLGFFEVGSGPRRD